MTPHTTALARFVATLDISDLPDRTIESAIQQTFEVCAGLFTGLSVPEATTIRRVLSSSTAGWAGEVAMLSHAAEWDPIHSRTAVCAAAVTVPVVLGIAKERDVDGPTAISAIVAGYEAAIRIGDALRSARLLTQGWWPTSLCGGAGAAAAAARAMGLDEIAMRNAIGLALVQAGGLSTGGASAPEARNLLCANTVRVGVDAALAAAAGIRGPAEPLTGERGFLHAFGVDPDPALLLADLGDAWMIDQTSLKRFPCALQAQPALDALSSILRDHGLSAVDLRAIEIGLPEPMRRIVDRPERPRTRFAAAASLQFLTAAMAVHGDVTPETMDESHLNSSEVADVADRVAVDHDPELESLYPARWPARVSVRTEGAVHEASVETPRGHPDNPIDLAATTAKFRTHAPNGAETLERLILQLPGLEDIRLLVDALDELLPA